MYAIIFWPNDQTVKPILNFDGSLFLCETIEEADKYAGDFEIEHPTFEARVISIESVNKY